MALLCSGDLGVRLIRRVRRIAKGNHDAVYLRQHSRWKRATPRWEASSIRGKSRLRYSKTTMNNEFDKQQMLT